MDNAANLNNQPQILQAAPEQAERGLVPRAVERLKSATKTGVLALSLGLAAPVAAQEPSETPVVLASYADNPAFQEFQQSGLTRGDRGEENPNRFEPFIEMFAGFTPASQDFILRAFSAGKLTEVEEDQNLDFENGKLAANLIRMTADIEIMARYIETREIPASQQIPRASDNFDRMIRSFPEVASVLSADVQNRIIALEEQVIVVLDEEVAKDEQSIAELRRQNEIGRQLNDRLEALLGALQS